MKVCSLGSGSKGNAIFIKNKETAILIDAGLSALQIKKRLKEIGEMPENINAIFISHEHADHVQGLRVFTKNLNIPIFISAAIKDFFENSIKNFQTFYSGDTISFKNLNIKTYRISHDALDPVGFKISNGEKTVGIATDIGKTTLLVKEELSHCNAIFLEFNHDENMLINGPYPFHLKQRIKSNVGHLSNKESIELVKYLKSKNKDLSTIFMSHISEINNSLPKIRQEILKNKFKNITFYFTYQHKISKYIEV